MTDITMVINSKRVINVLKVKIDALQEEVAAEENWILNNCPHPAEIVERNYCSGGYDYVSSVKVVHTCAICGHILKFYNDPNHIGSHA